jgi:hypothetical protein
VFKRSWIAAAAAVLAAAVALVLGQAHAGALPCDSCRRGTIGCPGLVSSRLTTRDCSLEDGRRFEVWRLEVPAELEVTIDLRSGDFDPTLYLLDGSCSELAFDDDGGPGLSSRVTRVLDAGRYLVLATPFVGDASRSGDYVLEVSCVERIDPRRLCAEICNVGVLHCGEGVEAVFPHSGCERRSGQLGEALDVWTVEVASGRSELTLSLASREFDTFLELYDAECRRLSFDDDGGEGVGSRLAAALPPGTYYAGVSSFLPGRSGAYRLEASCAASVEVCSDCDVGALRCDEPLHGSFPRTPCRREDGTGLDLYSFVAAGGEVAIDLAGDFDALVEIYSEDCVLLGRDDDGGDGLNARLVASLVPGRYRAGVSSADRGGAGSFRLTVSCAPTSTQPLFFRGDSNADGRLDVTDAVYVLRYLFLGGAAPSCLEAADSDDDGNVRLTDGIVVLLHLFRGGEAPAPPGPPRLDGRCGSDPSTSAGDLGCADYGRCP